MKLPVSFIQLPLQFDAAALARELAGYGPEHWHEHPEKYPGNLWLPLIAAEGDPGNDAFAGPMRPTPYLERSPYLTQVLARIAAVWGRTRLMKLTARAEVNPHFDINYYWRERMRVHVPILTQPSVRFLCGDAEVNMAPGECWIFDTWRRHQVINAADVERIHLVADTVGSDDFSELVRAGRMSGRPAAPDWRAENVVPNGAAQPALRCESVNLPVVMTPWEMREHIGFLLRETRPHPELELAQAVTARFLGAWHALWSEFGTDAAGFPAYRKALNTYEAFLRDSSGGLHLINEAPLYAAMRLMVLSVALRDGSAGGGELRQDTVAAAPGPRADARRDAEFERPVFIVSPPRSGSTLLFEILAQAPGVYTIGDESHALIEGTPGLSVLDNEYASNRMDAAAATPDAIAELRRRFLAKLRDRDGNGPLQRPLRLLEKTPKNALRVPFLARVFPEAQFVYLQRDVRQTLGSMIDAWQSGRFNTYPQLPGWNGPPWSLLLTPGWRELIGKPLAQIVAAQWNLTVRTVLDDLAALPRERVQAIGYDALLADPAAEISRLCRALDFAWDRPLGRNLPLSRYTLSQPAPDKWRRHEAEIAAALPSLAETIARSETFAAR